jgi:hypothetical protein
VNAVPVILILAISTSLIQILTIVMIVTLVAWMRTA